MISLYCNDLSKSERGVPRPSNDEADRLRERDITDRERLGERCRSFSAFCEG